MNTLKVIMKSIMGVQVATKEQENEKLKWVAYLIVISKEPLRS